MHFKNGREAHEGDPVVFVDYTKKVNVGRIHSLVAGSDTCNCQVANIVPGAVLNYCTNLKDLYHAEDAHSAVEQFLAVKQGAKQPA